MKKTSKIYIAGHPGMVGGAVLKKFQALGYSSLITASRSELELLNAHQVEQFFSKHQPEIVVLAAAKVGGIVANNTYPVEFLAENLLIECHVIQSAAKYGCQRLLFLGSSCIYPKHAPQPIEEDSLLTGPLEPTNEAYALAKIAGLKLCDYYSRQYGKQFISAMPTNLYGPGDNYHSENSHVIPGLLRRFHEAKVANSSAVKVWGTGSPLREFLHVEDLADALILLLEKYEGPGPINVGTGEDLSIRALAEMIREVVGFQGEIQWDTSRPDGTPRKVLNVDRIHSLGWKAKIPLRAGLEKTYRDAVKAGLLK